MQPRPILLIDATGDFAERLIASCGDSSFEISLQAAALGAPSRQAAPMLIIAVLGDSLFARDDAHALKTLHGRFPDTPLLVVSKIVTLSELEAAVAAGASGLLPFDVPSDALRHSLQLAILGEKIFPSDLVSALIDGAQPSEPEGDLLQADLSPREKIILEQLADGRSNKAIARRLDIAEGTVKVHVKVLFKKIGARNRTEAAIWALHHGVDMPA